MVVASEFLGNRQFASVIVAAEQGDHIPGELRNHQAAPFGECKLLLVYLHLDHIPPLARRLANSCNWSS